MLTTLLLTSIARTVTRTLAQITDKLVAFKAVDSARREGIRSKSGVKVVQPELVLSGEELDQLLDNPLFMKAYLRAQKLRPSGTTN